MSKSPAVQEAEDRSNHNAVQEKDGVKFILHPVAPALMDAVTKHILPPTVPVWFDKEIERDVPNPNHPDYLLALEQYNQERGNAVYDAMVMFGIELVEGLPESDWLARLQNLERHKRLDLSGYDLQDPLDVEFLYKRFILATGDMVAKIGNLSSVTAADVKAAGESFPGNS